MDDGWAARLYAEVPISSSSGRRSRLWLWNQTRRVRSRRAGPLPANLSRLRYAIIAMPAQMSNAGSTMTTMALSMA